MHASGSVLHNTAAGLISAETTAPCQTQTQGKLSEKEVAKS